MTVQRLDWRIICQNTLLALLALLSLGLASPASAQDVTPDRPANDPHLVDVNAGVATTPTQEVRIGDIAFALTWTGKALYTPSAAFILQRSTDRIVYLHGISKRFVNTGGTTYAPADGDGSTLVFTSATGAYTYTAPDGSVYAFTNIIQIPVGSDDKPGWPMVKAYLQTVTRPTGKTYTYYYALANKPSCGHTCFDFIYARVRSIVSNDGYMLKLTYAATIGTEVIKPTSAKLVNLSVDYCDPNADSCTSLTQNWPTQTIAETTSGATTTTTVTDQDSNTTTVSTVANGVTAIDQPGSTGGNVAIIYDASNRVDALTQDGTTYNYDYVDSGSNRTTTVTEPGSTTVTYVTDIPSSRVISVTNEVAKTTTYQYDSNGRKTYEFLPEGNYTKWTYDSRGNVTEIRHVAKASSGLADIVETASYETPCVHVAWCNKPSYTIDANNNRTDFEYDNTHGGLTRVRLPAPIGTTPRPEINYVYTLMYAQQKNASGVLVNAGAPQYKVTQITTCATAATCAGMPEETKTTISYNTLNLLPSSKTVAAGDGSLNTTLNYTYNDRGNLSSVDGALPGTADTTYYFFGMRNNLLGVIHPDPDSSGPRKRRAERYSYYWRISQLRRAEIGAVTGTTLADLNGMTADQTVEYSYDTNAHMTKSTLVSGGTTYQLTQYSYDSKNRLQCAAVRMNPAEFPSLPSDACTLDTEGSFGKDRITKTTYDNADRVTLVQTGYGVSGVEANEVATTYTDNGKVATITDAENNRTSYEYDGFDRLSKTRYPSTTKGALTSSSTDYEELVYDPNSNVTWRRLRGYHGDNTKQIGFTYDPLNRVTAKNLPGSEPDATYTYDLLNRITGASQTGNALTWGYDALSRMTSATSPLGTISYQYDAAGQRIQMNWPGTGTLYVTYEYQTTGELTRIRENGTTLLVKHLYDDLGRPTSLERKTPAVSTTNYGYDAASRLASLSQDLASTANDVSTTFSNINPAGQIGSLTRSNDLYSWTGAVNVNRGYTTNGLNQHTVANPGGSPTNFGYDARGNLTTSGTSTYNYSSENLLTSGPGVTLTYDPALRLYQTTGAATTKFLYDGSQIIAEYDNAGTVLRRYVHDAGADTPIVWYEGSGIGTRRFFHADERGSIVAVTDGSGAVISGGVNRYDEYGIPSPTNLGRFQYTGQTWLPELEMYYYKARVYSPTLGRFMQPDPILYGDGMNMYNYVGSDPVNFTDPAGLRTCTAAEWERGDADCDEVVVTGTMPGPGGVRYPRNPSGGNGGNGNGNGLGPQTRLVKDTCAGALARAAAASASINLPFTDGTRNALNSLGYGNPRMQLTDSAMSIAGDYVRDNPALITRKTDLHNGYTKAYINFGYDAYFYGYGGRNTLGAGPGPLGAILGRATIYLSSETGELVGLSDHFDYDPSNADAPLSIGMGMVDADITNNCPNRVSQVLITGGIIP